MTPDDKKKWTDALRSGDYTQTVGKLRDAQTDAMCCLGVMIDVLAPERWLREDIPDHDGVVTTFWNDTKMMTAGFPSYETCEALGVDLKIAGALASTNDNGGTFAEIALMIDARL